MVLFSCQSLDIFFLKYGTMSGLQVNHHSFKLGKLVYVWHKDNKIAPNSDYNYQLAVTKSLLLLLKSKLHPVRIVSLRNSRMYIYIVFVEKCKKFCFNPCPAEPGYILHLQTV